MYYTERRIPNFDTDDEDIFGSFQSRLTREEKNVFLVGVDGLTITTRLGQTRYTYSSLDTHRCVWDRRRKTGPSFAKKYSVIL